MYVNVRAIIEREGKNGVEIVIQKRVKAHESGIPYELPGGRLEEFESFTEGIKREVFEETGLQVTKVFGEETRVETDLNESNVEAMKPFAVYQTLQGPVDSIGFYFRCQAVGELVQRGDESEDIQWISVEELQNSLDNHTIDFSWVDQSGMMYYLKWHAKNRRNEMSGSD